jgi:hypothetical protein
VPFSSMALSVIWTWQAERQRQLVAVSALQLDAPSLRVCDYGLDRRTGMSVLSFGEIISERIWLGQ